MIFKRIRCSRCGHEGPGEIGGTVHAEEKIHAHLFTSEGIDPSSGMLYFRCLRCKGFIVVESDDHGSDKMNGSSKLLQTEVFKLTGTRDLMPA